MLSACVGSLAELRQGDSLSLALADQVTLKLAIFAQPLEKV